MNEEIVACKCGYKCVKSTLYKTDGKCPRCTKMIDNTIKEKTKEVA